MAGPFGCGPWRADKHTGRSIHMMEPLFGSNPLQPGVPAPGFGWFPLPFALANRPPIGPGTLSTIPNVSLGPQTVAQPMSQEAYGYGGAMPAVAAPGFMGQTIAPVTFGIGTPGPAGIPEIGTVHR